MGFTSILKSLQTYVKNVVEDAVITLFIQMGRVQTSLIKKEELVIQNIDLHIVYVYVKHM